MSTAFVDAERDVSTFPDLDAAGNWSATGQRAIAEAIARRLQTPSGTLFYDGDFGFDVRRYLNEGVTTGAMSTVRSMVQNEAEKDERVSAADVDVDWNLSTQTMTIRIALLTAVGPFAMTLAVDKISATVLSIE